MKAKHLAVKDTYRINLTKIKYVAYKTVVDHCHASVKDDVEVELPMEIAKKYSKI